MANNGFKILLVIAVNSLVVWGEDDYIPEVPDECKELGFCESVPNYPEEHAEKVLESMGDKVNNFQGDVGDYEVDKPANRRFELDIEICPVNLKRIIIPQSLPDEDGKWFLVLNPKKYPRQKFHVEMCVPHSSCSGIAVLQDGYNGTCQQKYIKRKVDTLSLSGTPLVKSLRVPTCCNCVATRNT